MFYCLGFTQLFIEAMFFFESLQDSSTSEKINITLASFTVHRTNPRDKIGRGFVLTLYKLCTVLARVCSRDAFPVCLQQRENFLNFLLDFHSLVLTLSLILFMAEVLSKV